MTIKEQCIEKYGFYIPELKLGVNKLKDDVIIKPIPTNFKILIEKNDTLSVKYSIIHDCVFVNNEKMDDFHILKLTNSISDKLKGAKVSKNDIRDQLYLIAYENKFNPIKDWLESLESTQTNYLETWLIDICGAEDTPINRIIGKKWFISAVARGVSPGCYVEGALIFKSEQGSGKTKLLSNLPPDKQYYLGNDLNFSKMNETVAMMSGKWIIDFNELNSIRKNELESIKAFLTNTEDTVQKKYRQESSTIKRSSVFCGSTNEDQFLIDQTGNRRFWCVAVSDKINVDKFLSIKNELWREAYQAYLKDSNNSSYCWTLSDYERELLNEENEEFMETNPLTEFLKERLCNYIDQQFSFDKINSEILKDYKGNKHSRCIGQSMKSLGYERVRTTAGNRQRVYIKKGYQLNDADEMITRLEFIE